MPKFSYKVKQGPGEVVTGVLEAESLRAANTRLRDMGYFPISIDEHLEEEKKDFLRQALIRIKLKDRNIFFRGLANLIESGMPITRSLRTLEQETANPKMIEIITHLRESIQNGASFADALRLHPAIFSDLSVNLVEAGETGGMLEESLWRLVEFGEQDEELRGKAFSAMVYPAFLLIMGTIAIFILVSFVFPKFIVFFEDFNAELPLPTVMVMSFCNFMGHFWWAVIIAAGFAVYAFKKYAKSPAGKDKLDRLYLKIPVLGGVVQRYEMAKFAQTLGTLFDNGVPVLSSLRITAETLGNEAIKEEVLHIHAVVTEGGSVSDSLRDSKHFPSMVVSMLAVGEEGGRLGGVCKRIAQVYIVEVDRAVKAMAALFEPILIVIMGIIIGFLVIAMLLPMMTLSTHIQ